MLYIKLNYQAFILGSEDCVLCSEIYEQNNSLVNHSNVYI